MWQLQGGAASELAKAGNPALLSPMPFLIGK